MSKDSLKRVVDRVKNNIGKRSNMVLLEVLVMVAAGVTIGCAVGYFLFF